MAQQHIRRYEVGGRIASGGMAEIVAASAVAESGVAKRVVLKKIRPELCATPDFVARFLDEARLAMRLSHANIVQVFDFGRTDEGQYFLAMEFVEGIDLHRFAEIAPGKPLPLAEALFFVAQTLRGLDYAHRRTDDSGHLLGIVHRDVKPANVLLSFEGEVKLTDFGVARWLAPTSAPESVCGTIAYMSPEQARGDAVDARSDVFSAGTMLCKLMTGEHPFARDTNDQTLRQVCEARFDLPSKAGLPAALDALLLRAMALDPSDRFPTAGAFADAIEELLFAHGMRVAAAQIARRVSETFAGERERLSTLFAPAARGEELAVAVPDDPKGFTQLSRVAGTFPPSRRTQVAETPEPRRRGRAAAWGAVAFVSLVAVGALVAALWPTNAPVPELTIEIPPPAPAPVLPDPPPPPAADDPAPAEAQGSRGTLTVNASPWANVFVNGRFVQTTPLLRHSMRVGPATVVVENPKLGRRVVPVRIEKDKDTPVIVDLRQGTGAK